MSSKEVSKVQNADVSKNGLEQDTMTFLTATGAE